jgi:hypothetical protein
MAIKIQGKNINSPPGNDQTQGRAPAKSQRFGAKDFRSPDQRRKLGQYHKLQEHVRKRQCEGKHEN